MDNEIETVEERLNCFLGQLQTEYGVFDRIVYKNKNQHRRSSYFQYLLKVRRDLRLLQSANLEEILTSCFHVLTGKKPKKKVHLLESLKWRKCDGRSPNFMERLLGATRLLSQMVEPILKAAIGVSTLLARTFFMGFSVTALALLARLRVLVQQILLDVVSVFNMVSSLSQKKQSVKIDQGGIEVFREYYPSNKEFVTLECSWKRDKFILLEKTHKSNIEVQDADLGDASVKKSGVKYKSLEAFLGDDSDMEDLNEGSTVVEARTPHIKVDEKDSIKKGNRMEVEGGVDIDLRDNLADVGTSEEKLPPEGSLLSTTSSSPSSKALTPNPNAKSTAFVSSKRPTTSKAAFISVKRPETSTESVTDLHSEKDEKDSKNKEDSFFNFLSGGNVKDSLF